jgi:hypothetical protein
MFNKNVGLRSDDRDPVLPAHAWRAAVPAPWRWLPDPGHDPRRGVRPGPQVRPARAPEAVKRKAADKGVRQPQHNGRRDINA